MTMKVSMTLLHSRKLVNNNSALQAFFEPAQIFSCKEKDEDEIDCCTNEPNRVLAKELVNLP